MLRRIAYLLFPFPDLDGAVYDRVATGLAGDSAMTELIDAGLAELESRQDGAWLAKTEDEQVTDLDAIEHTPFFQATLNATRVRLFNDRTTWEYLNYGGSSMAFGGYIDRGLDDIDWLDDL